MTGGIGMILRSVPFAAFILLTLTRAFAAFDPASLFDKTSLTLPQSDRILYEVSSYDRENRNIGDGFFAAHYLYPDHGGYAVFDEAGPGVLVNFWTPRDTTGRYVGTVSFYFDDDSLPAVSLPRSVLFGGMQGLFPYPLAVNDDAGSGGNYLFSPLPFKKRLRVVFSQTPSFYHFLYYKLKEGDGIETLDPAVNYSALAGKMAGLHNSGSSLLRTTDITLPPNTLTQALSLNGPATIREIRIAPSKKDLNLLKEVLLVAYWDDSPYPQVLAPLPDLFGCRYAITPFQSAFARVDSFKMVLSMPMPFFRNARIYLKSENSLYLMNFNVTVAYDQGVLPASTLLFNAYSHGELSYYTGHDFPVMSSYGHGCYAGAFLYLLGDRSRLFLEGDERVYVDGRSFPDFYGTGLEDYVLGGWYFDRGVFSQPFSGFLSSVKGGQDAMSLYRFHLSDRIPFMSHIKVGIEKDPFGPGSTEFSSVAFYYHADSARMVQTDTLVIDDTLSERKHGFKAGRLLDKRSVWSGYAGDSVIGVGHDFNYIADWLKAGVHLDPDNRGAIVRMFTDCVYGGQSVSVYADSQYAGHFLISAENPFLRFYDADFFLPESMTRGRDSLTLLFKVDGDNRATGMNMARFEIYSLTADTAVPDSFNALADFEIRQDWADGTRQMLAFRAPPDSVPLSRILIYRDTATSVPLSPDRLIGQTTDLCFTDDRLIPGRRYYYRCVALNRYGRKTGESPVKNARTPGVYNREGETLFPSLYQASCSSAVHLTYNEDGKHDSLPLYVKGPDTLISNGRYLDIFCGRAGDSASYLLYAPGRDTFDVALNYIMGRDFGKFRMAVNNRPVSLLADGFADSEAVGGVHAADPIILEAGNNLVTFSSAGKFGRSAGYRIGIDKIWLSTLGQRYEGLPDSMKLVVSGIYPNPFNPLVSVRYEIAENGRVQGEVFDVNGRLVKVLIDRTLARRNYVVRWDGTNSRGQACPSGVYFIRIRMGSLSRTVTAVMAR